MNVASRMEIHGQPERLQTSGATLEAVGDHLGTQYRGEVDVQGKRYVPTRFVRGATS